MKSHLRPFCLCTIDNYATFKTSIFETSIPYSSLHTNKSADPVSLPCIRNYTKSTLTADFCPETIPSGRRTRTERKTFPDPDGALFQLVANFIFSQKLQNPSSVTTRYQCPSTTKNIKLMNLRLVIVDGWIVGPTKLD